MLSNVSVVPAVFVGSNAATSASRVADAESGIGIGLDTCAGASSTAVEFEFATLDAAALEFVFLFGPTPICCK